MLFVHKKHAVTAAQRIKADFNVSMRRQPESNLLSVAVPTVLL